MHLIRMLRIRPWFLYTPPVAICDGFHVEHFGGSSSGQPLSWPKLCNTWNLEEIEVVTRFL